MTAVDDRIAAITGAGSGIGRGLAIALAARRCELALSDVDGDGLAATAELADKAGAGRITTATVDVGDRRAVERWAEVTATEHGGVNLIFNNAGVALDAPVASISYDDVHWLMNTNFWGVVHGTTAFLPLLKQSARDGTGDGHVVNISSVFGLVGIPGQSAYNAAKFAVRGFTEALRIELDQERSGVSATTVHPGGIKTNIVRNARFGDPDVDRDEAATRFDKAARTTPDKAAQGILRAVEKNKRRVMIGPDAHVFDLIARLPPGFYQRAIGRLFTEPIA
jgi:NAD(P)-dependent dehydrogenase (short-subunit alcohol dehydrogenase family)